MKNEIIKEIKDYRELLTKLQDIEYSGSDYELNSIKSYGTLLNKSGLFSKVKKVLITTHSKNNTIIHKGILTYITVDTNTITIKEKSNFRTLYSCACETITEKNVFDGDCSSKKSDEVKVLEIVDEDTLKEIYKMIKKDENAKEIFYSYLEKLGIDYTKLIDSKRKNFKL